jgi:O-antigen/teichoic acid export membrane protein
MFKSRFNLTGLLTPNSFTTHVAKLVGGTTVAHLFTLLISPVLTRIFPAEAFGELQLFHSVVVILTILSTGCFEYTFVLPKRDENAAILFRLSFIINLSFSAFLYLIISFIHANEWLSGNFNSIVLWLIPVGVFFNSALNILVHWIVRFEQYGVASRSKVIQSFTVGGTQVSLGFLGTLNFGLISGHVFGRFISTVYLFFKRIRIRVERDYLKKNKQSVTAKYSEIVRFLIPSNILSYGALEIPVFIISSFFGQEILGFYSLAYRVLSVPSAFIGNSVGQVFFKQLSDRYNAEKLIRNFLYKTWGVLFLITIIPTLILILWAEPIFAFVFGDQWITAGTIAMIMAPLLAIDFISAPTGKTLVVLEKQKVMPLFSLINLLARAGGLLIGWYQNDFFLGLTYMVVGHIFGLVIYNLYLIKAVHSYESSVRNSK